MIGTFDYQERVSECARWAQQATNRQARTLWKEMERFWRQRAIRSFLKPEPQSPDSPDFSVDGPKQNHNSRR